MFYFDYDEAKRSPQLCFNIISEAQHRVYRKYTRHRVISSLFPFTIFFHYGP